MEISYERKHNDSFMVIDGNGKSIDYENKMINANHISSLLTMSSFALDGKEKRSYTISRKENLEDFIDAHDITIEMLERIIINLQLALDEVFLFFGSVGHLVEILKTEIGLTDAVPGVHGQRMIELICTFRVRSRTVQPALLSTLIFFVIPMTIVA